MLASMPVPPTINKDSTMADSFLHFSKISFQPTPDPKHIFVDDPRAAKKLIHNANERHCRRRVNNTYFHLRSLLPGTLQRTKKMSIPATIGHVLKYIPELQQVVQGLIQEKQELWLRIRMQGDVDGTERKREPLGRVGSVSITGSQIGNGGIMVQISTYETNICAVLLFFEQHGLLLVHASSFRSSCGLIHFNLHFKVRESGILVDCELLSNKIKSLLGETLYVVSGC